MVQIGRQNTLRILQETPSGLYLDGGELGEILLPGKYIPRSGFPGAEVEVFVHRDSEDRLVATTETPLAMVGDFACLEVVSVQPAIGAFLNWGLGKDLLLPIREQKNRVRAGDRVVVYVYFDTKTERVVASSRLNRHLDLTVATYTEGQPVNLLIAGESPLGFNAIVENAHSGLLFRNETGTALRIGQRLKGYVRTLRPDGKINLALDPAGYTRIAPLSEEIIEKLKAAGGRLEFHDKSSPEEIRRVFGASKKSFKQAVGALFSERRIRLERDGIELVQ
ncbi:MAG: GntR family transcriptional regulator [Verrucomicrobia bacterium]|nr:GntR family transcriptional regulator [Verrucomicrobiota bacterium]